MEARAQDPVGEFVVLCRRMQLSRFCEERLVKSHQGGSVHGAGCTSIGELRTPLVLRGCIGIGHAAGTGRSGRDTSMDAEFLGLGVVIPSHPRDAKGLWKRMLRGDDPVLFLERRELLSPKGPVPTPPPVQSLAFSQGGLSNPPGQSCARPQPGCGAEQPRAGRECREASAAE